MRLDNAAAGGTQVTALREPPLLKSLVLAIEAAEVPENDVPIASYRPGVPARRPAFHGGVLAAMDCLLADQIAFFPRAEAFL